MCTALTYLSGDFYMGRTLDYERGYGEEVVVTPRAYPFAFRHEGLCAQHYAIIGTACVADGYPLYYDAVNEKGLGMAGLNFVGNAAYAPVKAEAVNVAVGTPFSPHFPAAQLHWLVADRTGALVVESMADGLHVYDCPEGVLTNNPPFPIQHFGLNRYMGLSPRQPENRFSDQLELSAFSRGMGALGLPGDLSSGSRFVRAAFVRANSRSCENEAARVGQFFHILGAVEQQKGCCEVRPGEFEYTIYTSCWNAQRGVYYYTTYGCRQIHAVDLHREDLDSTSLARYPMQTEEPIQFQN